MTSDRTTPTDATDAATPDDADRSLAADPGDMTHPTAYSGHVNPGGPPIHRTVRHGDATVQLTKVSVGRMDNNCYLLRDTGTGRAVIIDAAADPNRILPLVSDAHIVTIVTTHGHRDHWQALAEVADATGATVAHHPDDADDIPVEPGRTLGHGDTVTFGDVTLDVRHTPGHTPGSICLVLEGRAVDRPDVERHLFTGDTLFPGGPGKTTSSEQFERIMHSLRDELFALPDETWVYPGHGDDTTLGAERAHLDAWQDRGW